MDIEATAEQAIAELGLGDCFTLDALLGAVKERRQRALRIVELSDLKVSDGLCAIWLITEREDLILHAHTDSVLHRQQFVLHELAHMLLGHDEQHACDLQDALLPDIPPHTRGRILTRGDLKGDSEIAAELVADGLAAAIRASAFGESRYSEIFG
ncbi:MAG: hypothetical protein JSS74_10415 [Actinobacteria bacterium]|nr:hypothetical protein [Actinomycetota bacterium]